MSSEQLTARWPSIRGHLRMGAAGNEGDFCGWSWRVEEQLSSATRAAAYEEWADFFEWCLQQRTAELAGDRVKRHLVEQWTDSMAYSCRRSAAWARGEDPGTAIPQHERRPDLEAERHAILVDLLTELDTAHAARRSSSILVLE